VAEPAQQGAHAHAVPGWRARGRADQTSPTTPIVTTPATNLAGDQASTMMRPIAPVLTSRLRLAAGHRISDTT
jgi:hypothetical protein